MSKVKSRCRGSEATYAGNTVHTHMRWLIMPLMLLTVLLALSAQRVYGEHDEHTFTFEFSGSSATVDRQDFIIEYDGALYVKLLSCSDCATDKPTIGFMKIEDSPGCPARYQTLEKDAEVGVVYGPYYMQAGSYKSYFATGLDPVDYSMEIEYRRQLVPNDVEPNDDLENPQDLGNLSRFSDISGHLGYLGCIHDRWDYLRFGVVESGAYLFDIQFDSPFREKTGCTLEFRLTDETGGFVVAQYTGPQDVSDLVANLDVQHTYRIYMLASDCFDTVTDSNVILIVNNKAGAYQISLHQASAPFAITKLTLTPTTIWAGESMDVNVFLQNFTNASIEAIELDLQVIRPAENALLASKQYSVYLSPAELKEINFEFKELMTPEEVLSHDPGEYRIRAVAQLRDASGQVTASSSKEATFEITRDNKDISGGIYMLLNKEKEK